MQQTPAVTKGFGSAVIFVVILIIGSFVLPPQGRSKATHVGQPVPKTV